MIKIAMIVPDFNGDTSNAPIMLQADFAWRCLII